MIRVAAFTAGRNVPAARFRIRQYIDSVRANGIELSEFCPVVGAYPPKRRWARPAWALAALAARMPGILQSFQYDISLFQREMLSTFITLEPLTKKPRVLDVDDAIWLNRNTSFARRLAEISDLVICGNTFLAEYFRQWNSSITVLATAVDSDRFVPLISRPVSKGPVIGWSGSSSGFEDLRIAQDALRIILRKHPNARLRIIANEPPELDLPPGQVEFVRWSPAAEVESVQTLDVGLMPLRDTLWSRGKCSYKMLLYMSCGVPVVVSPVGMNSEVLKMGAVGASANTTDDWVGAVEDILGSPQSAGAMGRTGREVVVRNFSLHALAPRLAAELVRVSGRSSS